MATREDKVNAVKERLRAEVRSFAAQVGASEEEVMQGLAGILEEIMDGPKPSEGDDGVRQQEERDD